MTYFLLKICDLFYVMVLTHHKTSILHSLGYNLGISNNLDRFDKC